MNIVSSLITMIAAGALVACGTASPHREPRGQNAMVKASVSPNPGKVDPNQVLAGLEADVSELMAANDKKTFAITPADSRKAKAILSAMYLDLANLHAKYATTKGDINAAEFYKEIEAMLDEKEGNGKSLILSLRRKGVSAQAHHECENFCWESCGHNSVGEWVCFLTCRRRC